MSKSLLEARKKSEVITHMLEFLTGVAEYLEALIDANHDLLYRLVEYQKVLVAGETDEIEHATPGVDRLAGKIRIIDEERRVFVDNYFREKGLTGPRNFSAISEKVMEIGVTDEESIAFERAKTARMKLIEVLAEVDAQNSLNITLIGQGMTFAEASLRALLGFDNRPESYGPASDDEDEGPSLLDAQA